MFQVFEENAHKIKKDSLGGPDSFKSKLFNQELNELKDVYSKNYKTKTDFIKNQIKKSDALDAMMKERGVAVSDLFEKNIIMSPKKPWL